MLVQNITLQKLSPEAETFSEFFKLPAEIKCRLTREEIVNEHFHSAYILKLADKVVGRFALYVNPSLQYVDQPAITIGSYACINDDYIAKQLLTNAEGLSKQLGYSYIIGPMNGSTWHSHRLSARSGGKKFCLDLENPEYYNEQFTKEGYESIGEYFSSKDETFVDKPTKLNDIYWNERGLVIRNIKMNNLKEELRRIAEFSNEAFSNNFLFTPIKVEHFVNKYIKHAPVLSAKHIWICEDNTGVLQSFFFGIPDFQNKNQLILKSAAIKKGSPFRGITTYMFRKMTRLAKQEGFTSIVHAFMHKSNISYTTSKNHGKVFKEYVLYGKQL